MGTSETLALVGQNGAKFTLVLKSCFTGSEGNDYNGIGVLSNRNIARDLSNDIKGLTFIAPSGSYNVFNFLNSSYEWGIMDSENNTWNVYYNGKLIKRFND